MDSFLGWYCCADTLPETGSASMAKRKRAFGLLETTLIALLLQALNAKDTFRRKKW